MSDTLQTVTEPMPVPPVRTDETESISRLREQIAALASVVDGLYDELDNLTHQQPGGRLSDAAVIHLETLIADARRLIPADIHLDRVARLVGGHRENSRPAGGAALSNETVPGELELWLAGHTG
jgi:hypothetical protein